MILVGSQFHVRRARHGGFFSVAWSRKKSFSNLKRMRTKRMRWIKWLSLYIPVIFPKNPKNPKTSWLWPWVSLIVTYQYIRENPACQGFSVTSCYQVSYVDQHLIWGWDQLIWFLECHRPNLAFVNDFMLRFGGVQGNYASSSPISHMQPE